MILIIMYGVWHKHCVVLDNAEA